MSIEDEARAEAERRFPMSLAYEYGSGDAVILTRIDFVKGAVWASQCEPTDAEIEAAARAIDREQYGPDSVIIDDDPDEPARVLARAALIAALSARNTRENQA